MRPSGVSCPSWPRLVCQERTALPARYQVSRCTLRSTTIWSRSATVSNPPGGSQARRRLAEGSSTAVQPTRRWAIGTVSSTPASVGSRKASGRPPGASYAATRRVGCTPSVSGVVSMVAGSAGNPLGAGS